MQISEYCSVEGLTLRMGKSIEKTFSSEEELDKAIYVFQKDCHEFAEKHKGLCSSVIEEACFPV